MPYIVVFSLFLFIPLPALALLPPDVLFSVGTSVVQFFSISALLIAGMFSSFVIIIRKWLSLSWRKLLIIIGTIFFVTLVVITIVYMIELQKQRESYKNEIMILQSENASLQEVVESSVLLNDYQNLLKELRNDDFNNLYTFSSSTQSRNHFFGDLLILYGKINNQPFALELDFNRLEKSSGVFSHYTFLDGNIGNNLFSDYDIRYSTSTELVTNNFINKIERVYANDLSSRDVYIGEVSVLGKPLTFRVENLQGDFVSRNRSSYMQYQSVGTAIVGYDGQESKVYAMVEGVFSVDYTKHLFFPNRNTVDAKTYQFMLWDKTGNFYLIDESQVFSVTPEYPSHTWVLYKNADGTMKKSFEATIKTLSSETGTISWVIEIPEIDTQLELIPTQPFKQTGNERFRSMVGGYVTSEYGKREIEGVAHLIE